MHEDTERCVRAVQSKDDRFDGWFFTAVLTTGIYCRPSCPATPPKPQNMRFFPSAAAAQQAGFRACKRCRPDASPGSPEWNERADLVARAMRLIADGVVDRDGVSGLAGKLGYSVRQIERQLRAELGAGPLALARAQRAQTARLLIETTALPMGDIAFAAGFPSIRTFNDTVLEVFALAPTELRRRAAASHGGAGRRRCGHRIAAIAVAPAAVPGADVAGQPVRPPGRDRRAGGRGMAGRQLPAHARGCPTVRAWWHCGRAPDYVDCQLALTDLRDLAMAISRCRRLLDLDADPVAVCDQLREDAVLAPLVDKAPGRRIPRTVDAAEFAIRAVLGQQVSTAAARTHAARLAARFGEPIDDPGGGLTRLFPDMAVLAQADQETVLAMPQARKRTLIALAGGDRGRRRGPGRGRGLGSRQEPAGRRAGPRPVDDRGDRDAGPR